MSTEQPFTKILRDWVEVFMQRSFRDFRQFMEQHDLSPSQVGTLMQLYHCGKCGVSDIGGHMGITVPAASQLVERLVQQGLLERTEDPVDRRYKQVTLSPDGRSLIEEGIAARRRWMEQLTDSLSPEQQHNITSALVLLTEAARSLDPE